MAPLRTERAISATPIRAPRGAAISCKGWPQEAALRLFMNSADPAVAEDAEHLIPSGGVGKLARDGQAFHAIVETLQKLEEDQTLLIRCGQAATLETREDAPRVIVMNTELPETWRGAPSPEMRLEAPGQARLYAADWMYTGPASALPEAFQVFRAAARKHFGGSLAGRLVVAAGMGGIGGAQALAATLNGGAFLGIDADASRIKRREKAGFCEVMVNNLDEALRVLKNAVRKREPASVGLIGNAAEILPELARRGVLPDLLTDQTPAGDLSGAYIPRGFAPADAPEMQQSDPRAYRERALDSIAAQVRAMLELKKLGAIVFEFGNGICAQALARGVAEAGEIPDFVSEYLLPDLAQGRGLLTVVPLSGDPGDLAQVDAACLELFPRSELREWISAARKHPSPGLPARSLWMTAAEAAKLAAAINGLAGNGAIKTPVALGRSMRLAASAKPVASILSQSSNTGAMADGKAIADSPPAVAALMQAALGACWVGLQAASGPGQLQTPSLCFAFVADGTRASHGRIGRVFAGDFAAAAPLFAS
jgi:urocanate hydratase